MRRNLLDVLRVRKRHATTKVAGMKQNLFISIVCSLWRLKG